MSLARFWTRELGRRVDDRVVVEPTTEQVPNSCRSALRVGTAFTCPANRAVYLTRPFVARLAGYPPRSLFVLRLAATMAHEMGHVVQFAVRQPGLNSASAQASRRIEQQADCLSGVWATATRLDAAAFRRAVRQVLAVVDGPFERRTHGLPAQRIAAVARGQRGTARTACGLAR